MDSYLVYLVQSSICMILFFAFYYLALRKETFYLINRIYLLSSLILSLIIPLIKFDFFSSVKYEVYKVYINPITISAGSDNLKNTNFDLAAVLYSLISLSIFIFLLLRITKILLLYRRNEKLKINGMDAAILQESISPFSFFKMLFVPKEILLVSDLDDIIRHERAHIKYFHSADNLILEVLNSIFWFNPVIYLYKKELRAVNEFFADQQMIAEKKDINFYKNILFSYTFNLQTNQLVSNFNSLLKRRFIMMNAKKSSAVKKFRLAYILPIALAAILSMNFISTGNMAMPINIPAAGDSVYSAPEVMPEYPGGQEALINYMIKNIKYPEDSKKAGIQGKVLVQFVIEKDGSLTNIKVKEPVNKELDVEAIRVIKEMPKWKPGMNDGKPVKTEMILPIMFALK